MSIKQAPYYWLECDYPGCTTTTNDLNSEYAAWADESQAIDDWECGDGFYVNGKAYCPNHSTSFCRECGTAEGIKEDADGWFRCSEHLEGEQ